MELNEKEVDQLIKRADANGNGVIDYAGKLQNVHPF